MFFTLKKEEAASKARAGVISTDHGDIETPIFMPVGTAGSVKAVHRRELEDDIDAKIILGNTYHLYLRPGEEILTRAGGLHQFTGWQRPMLTDSGGYQVFSLANNRKISEEGVIFQSHIDGSRHQFTPERSVEIQRTIGADIIMAFDECTPWPCDYAYAKASAAMTHRWLDRCFKKFNESECPYGYKQHLFPIVQGSTFDDLRKQSAEVIASKEAEGNAIGGLSVGEPAEEMYVATELVCSILPKEKPRYLMGVGTPENILECIALGVDMFDCVLPSRNARHGLLYTYDGIINIKNNKWKDDFTPIDDSIGGYASSEYSKAYLRHLMISGERLGAQIATLHNLSFYLNLVRTAREKIMAGQFSEWKSSVIKNLSVKR